MKGIVGEKKVSADRKRLPAPFLLATIKGKPSKEVGKIHVLVGPALFSRPPHFDLQYLAEVFKVAPMRQA